MQNTQKFCQSCSMPMTSEEQYGTEADGSRSQDYCNYCYEGGSFKGDMSMDQMIEVCVPYMKDQFGGEDGARTALKGFFPQLKRWAK